MSHARSIREIVEGPQTQGEDERIVYVLDITKWGSTPTAISVVVKNSLGTDVTREVTALVLASRARSANVATLVTDSAHGLTNGDHVTVFDCESAGYNAADVAVTVINSTTFTYANTGADEPTTAEPDGRVKTPTSQSASALTATSIQLPRLLKLTAGQQYRVEVKFTVAGQVLEAFFILIAEV